MKDQIVLPTDFTDGLRTVRDERPGLQQHLLGRLEDAPVVRSEDGRAVAFTLSRDTAQNRDYQDFAPDDPDVDPTGRSPAVEASVREPLAARGVDA